MMSPCTFCEPGDCTDPIIGWGPCGNCTGTGWVPHGTRDPDGVIAGTDWQNHQARTSEK